jgi:hypothetical protein
MVVTSFFADPQVEELILRTSSCDSERNRTLALRGEDALKVVNSLQRVRDHCCTPSALWRNAHGAALSDSG